MKLNDLLNAVNCLFNVPLTAIYMLQNKLIPQPNLLKSLLFIDAFLLENLSNLFNSLQFLTIIIDLIVYLSSFFLATNANKVFLFFIA